MFDGENRICIPQYGETPLHQAAYKGCTQAVDLLVNYLDADITKQNIVCLIPFSEEEEDFFLLFINSIKCPGSQVGDTPLHVTAYRGHAPIIPLLTKKDSPVTKLRNTEGDTPLHLAASGGHSEVVEKLLQEDSDVVNAQNFQGRTPLHEAAKNGSESVIKLLMKVPHIDNTVEDSVSDFDGVLTLMSSYVYFRRCFSGWSIFTQEGKSAYDLTSKYLNNEIRTRLKPRTVTRDIGCSHVTVSQSCIIS